MLIILFNITSCNKSTFSIFKESKSQDSLIMIYSPSNSKVIKVPNKSGIYFIRNNEELIKIVITTTN